MLLFGADAAMVHRSSGVVTSAARSPDRQRTAQTFWTGDGSRATEDAGGQVRLVARGIRIV